MRLVRGLKFSWQTLPIWRYRNIEGWLTSREAVALYRLARRSAPGSKIVEIGSWKGKSTYCLAKGLREGVIFAIDPFDGSGETGNRYDALKGEIPLLRQFRANLDRHDLLRKVEIKVGPSSKFSGSIKDIDILFIDGDHSIEGCANDFNAYSPDVKAKGILAFHDYNARRSDLGPTWVVDHLVVPSGQWTLIERHDSLIVFRKFPSEASVRRDDQQQEVRTGTRS